MKKYLPQTLLVLGIIFGVSSLLIRNNTVSAGFQISVQKEILSQLEDEYAEIETEYLALVLEHLEPQARKNGFVTVADPHYMKPDTVVGFLQEP